MGEYTHPGGDTERTWTLPRGKPIELSLTHGAEILLGAVENWGRLVQGEPFRSHLAEIADYRCEDDNPLFSASESGA